MKRLIALLLVLLISVLSLSLTACAAVDAVKDLKNESVPSQTLSLKDTWIDVWVEGNWQAADLTVTNYYTSAYDVKVRIVSIDYSEIIASEETIPSGYSATFSSVPSGNFIIQAKSADDVLREYTLSYHS